MTVYCQGIRLNYLYEGADIGGYNLIQTKLKFYAGSFGSYGLLLLRRDYCF